MIDKPSSSMSVSFKDTKPPNSRQLYSIVQVTLRAFPLQEISTCNLLCNFEGNGEKISDNPQNCTL